MKRIQLETAEQKLLWKAYCAMIDFQTTYNGRPGCYAEAEKVSAQSICDASDELEDYLFPSAGDNDGAG